MADSDKRYLLGLDAGNTVVKAVLFDTAGRQLALAVREGASRQPEPGHVERDLGELWSNACAVIGDCLAQSGVSPHAIAAVGCAGHGNGLYLLDDDGEPLLGIQSLDARAAALAQSLAAEHGDALRAICLQKPWPSQTATLLAWIKRNRPDLYARTGTAFMCKDFVVSRLTGERVSEISDMSGGGFLRMSDCRYHDGLLWLYGLADAAAKLPALVQPTDVAGHVTGEASAATGLAEGTPVVAGLFDVIASALGSGAVRAGQASIIAGTWSINQVFSDAPVVDPRVFMVSGFGPKRFTSIEASATSAANLEWYVRELVERGGHQGDPFGFCNARVAQVIPAIDDPFFHPFLYGSGASADARAGFYGLAGWHGEGHLLRALFEGVVFEHRRHVEVLARAGVAFDAAIMSGGGTRSPHWPQMMADGLGLPITVADCEETGARGAAIAAGVGAGLFPGLDEGVAAMTRAGAILTPDADARGHYDHRYRVYLSLIEAMRAFWAAQQASKDAGEAP